MSQQSTGSEPFRSLDEWRDYWGRELLGDMGIQVPELACAMCGNPTANTSGFCSAACETEYGASERIEG